MTVRTVDPKERARIQSILYMGIILLTSPFGWIGGVLSQANKNLPFILNIGLFVVGGLLAYLAGEASQKRERSGRARNGICPTIEKNMIRQSLPNK